MEILCVKKQILEQIREDKILAAKIAIQLDVHIGSVYRMLNENSLRLTQASVLNLLKTELGYDNTEDILEPLEQEDNNNTETSKVQTHDQL